MMRKCWLAMSVVMSVMGGEKIEVHGHRGARAAMPENTIPAFVYALEQGVDALELDLAVTRDNVLVVSHDPEMNERICTGPAGAKTRVIREMTLAELKQWDCGAKQNAEFARQKTAPGTRVPTLEEVLELARGRKVDLNIETKSFSARPGLTPEPEEFTRMVIEQVRRHGLEERLILQSFDWRTLEACRKLAPRVRTSALYPAGPGATGRDYISEAKAKGFAIVSPHYRLTTKAEVERAHGAGMKVVAWTANDEKTWAALVEAGVDAIITDDPAGLIAWMKGRGLR
ncbi:MAG: glycerophosphodiester phosphodiesterase [Acidobacteriota bacterium]|jgi:glycerophosphoryl diester phosphodiesterase